MGGIIEDIGLPHCFVMRLDIKLYGKWLYSRDDITLLVKMVNIGLLRLDDSAGIKIIGKYRLERWKEAFDVAAENVGQGQLSLFAPWEA